MFMSYRSDRQQWTLGTLSQYVGAAAAGYRALPPPPTASRDAALRDAAEAPTPTVTHNHSTKVTPVVTQLFLKDNNWRNSQSFHESNTCRFSQSFHDGNSCSY